jgi:hypothetical protein
VCSAVGRGIGVGYLKCCVDTIQLHRGQDRNVGHLEPEIPSYLHLTQDERVGIDSPEKHLGGAGLAECRPLPSCSPSDPWPRTPHWALDEECKAEIASTQLRRGVMLRWHVKRNRGRAS